MGYSWPARKREPRIRTKYGRTDCRGGCNGVGPLRPRWHHSAEEARYCDQLLLMKKAGEVRVYNTQVRYDLFDRHKNPCGYMLVDFVVIRADGRKQIHEYKGSGLANMIEFRHEKALFSWCYPAAEYIVVGKRDIVL